MSERKFYRAEIETAYFANGGVRRTGEPCCLRKHVKWDAAARCAMREIRTRAYRSRPLLTLGFKVFVHQGRYYREVFTGGEE